MTAAPGPRGRVPAARRTHPLSFPDPRRDGVPNAPSRARSAWSSACFPGRRSIVSAACCA